MYFKHTNEVMQMQAVIPYTAVTEPKTAMVKNELKELQSSRVLSLPTVD